MPATGQHLLRTPARLLRAKESSILSEHTASNRVGAHVLSVGRAIALHRQRSAGHRDGDHGGAFGHLRWRSQVI